MGYEQILVMDELSGSVQRAGGVPLQRRETLDEQVRTMVAQRSAGRPEDLILREPIRHEVRAESEGRSRNAR
jgi:hypothetical protein